MKTAPPITIIDTLVHLDPEEDIPLHAQVRRALQRVIEDHFEDGQQFWTEQALTANLDVSQITVRRALGDLAKEGLLVRRASRGSIVCKVDAAANYRVALFLTQYESDLLRYLLEQFVEECRAQGRRLEPIFINQGMRAADIMQMVERGPDEQRLVFLGLPSDLETNLSQLAADRAYRFVTVDMNTPHRMTDRIGIDDVEGIRIALRHLADLGHRRVTLIVNEPEASQSVVVRRRTFEQAARTLGLTGHVVSCGTRFWESAYDAAYDAMPRVWDTEEQERPTSILTVSDVGAWAVLKWFSERNIQVPEDVSVMGYNDERPSRFTTPALTTMRFNAAEMVKSALQCLDLPKTELAEIWVHPHLVVRESTAPPPAGRSKTPRSGKRSKTILAAAE
jgi:LacI family transcriptional regulator